MLSADSIPIFFAVLSASLVGSAHCVGMCGPFAVMVMKEGDSKSRRTLSMGWYHLGRAFTYALIGGAAGLAGAWLNLGTSFLGWQQTAAWLTGVGMIAFGIFALLRLARLGSVHFQTPAMLQKMARTGFRKANQLPAAIRPAAIGTVTGFLPCGWLYAFVLLAIGTSSPVKGSIVMMAFWLGTVPALSVIGLGFSRLSESWKNALPFCTAALMILAGISTVSMRAHAQLSTMASPTSTVDSAADIKAVTDQPLPCCQPADETDSSPEEKVPECCQNK